MRSNHRDLKKRAWAANLEIARRGLAIYTFGNASAFDREAGLVAIKPSGVAYEDLSVEDIVVLEEIARMAFVTRTIAPGAARLPEHLVRKHFERKHGADAYYGQRQEDRASREERPRRRAAASTRRRPPRNGRPEEI